MKKILGSALVLGILAYGLNGSVFANESKLERNENIHRNYAIEQLDENSNIVNEEYLNPNDSKSNDKGFGQNNFNGNCNRDGSRNGGCQGGRGNGINNENINYSNL